jgi:hypothetical protein
MASSATLQTPHSPHIQQLPSCRLVYFYSAPLVWFYSALDTFRYNNRKQSNSRRFEKVLSQVAGKRLTYAELTGKVGETAF